MSATEKAKRASTSIGSLEIEGFMMPDGGYRMSQTQVAEAVGKPEINARRFLDSRGIKALLGKGYTPDTIEVEPGEQLRGQSRINALPLEVISAYWIWQCSQGNKQAIPLVIALTIETLERRLDRAFWVARTEQERDQRLAGRFQALEQQIALLSEAYAEPDDLRERVSRLEEQLRQNGIEPWQIGGGDRS
ncbi:MAG: hypothetical protein AAFR42_09885 [Cyanobacteria bacterium J06628_6]